MTDKLEHLGDRLFCSTRPLCAEEMERGQPPGALAIVLKGRCHPRADLAAEPIGKKGGGPAVSLRCATCRAPVLALATAAPPVIATCACGRGLLAVYDLPAARLRLQCPGCSWFADLFVRRGAPPTLGPPASKGVEGAGPPCPTCGARFDAVFPSGEQPEAGAKQFCLRCGELAVYTAPGQVRAGTPEDLAGDAVGQQLAELARARARGRAGVS